MIQVDGVYSRCCDRFINSYITKFANHFISFSSNSLGKAHGVCNTILTVKSKHKKTIGTRFHVCRGTFLDPIFLVPTYNPNIQSWLQLTIPIELKFFP